MDVSNPLRAVSPTVDADVLLVLARTHAWLTGARVATLADRSYAQVRSVLHRLVADGVVEYEEHGSAYAYRLNRGHVAAGPIEQIADAANHVEQRLARALSSWDPQASALAVYGSFARRDGDSESDIDLLLIRQDDVDVDDEQWVRQRHELVRTAEQLTGNPAQVLEMSAVELAASVNRGDDLVTSLRREARVLLGRPLATVIGSNGVAP